MTNENEICEVCGQELEYVRGYDREAPWQVLIGPGRGSVFQNRCKKCTPLTTGACSGCEFRGLKNSTPKQGGK